MRLPYLCLIALFASGSLSAQTKPKLSTTVQLINNDLVIGKGSLALVKVLNKGDRPVFIDQEQVQIYAEFQYPDIPYIPPGIPGGIIAARSLKTDPEKRDIQSSIIIAIEPGQTFVRLIQVRAASRAGQAVLHVSAFAPVSSIDAINQTTWPYIALMASNQVNIRPSAKK
ncbi:MULTISPECIES: hypothetical protein [Geothrix]|uniref:hypothetical protein n=1 Tax=Geothrix TaxID=44675 RepID=UPI001FAE0EB5|nr:MULTISPECIES: hypothetical protein [Geothrix]